MNRPAIGCEIAARLPLLVCGGALALPVLAHRASADETIDIMVEDAAPPWSNADGTGYANDVVVAAFKEMGVKVKLLVVPYSRCKKMALSGDTPACFSMTWLPEFKDLIELSPEPLIKLNADVFENVEKPVPKSESGGCALPRGAVAGTVVEYEYPVETMALRAAGVEFETARSDLQSLKKLALRRIDAAIIITNDLEPTDRKAIESGTEKSVRFAFNCGIETGSIGFSLKHPRGSWAYETYESGRKRIEQNGVLKQIGTLWATRLLGPGE